MLYPENRDFIKFVRPLFTNKYIFTICIFVVWMIFFDKNNFIRLWKMQQKIDQMEAEKDFYEREHQNLEFQMEQIIVDPERYAREKYYLHKENEVVFLIRD